MLPPAHNLTHILLLPHSLATDNLKPLIWVVVPAQQFIMTQPLRPVQPSIHVVGTVLADNRTLCRIPIEVLRRRSKVHYHFADPHPAYRAVHQALIHTRLAEVAATSRLMDLHRTMAHRVKDRIPKVVEPRLRVLVVGAHHSIHMFHHQGSLCQRERRV